MEKQFNDNNTEQSKFVPEPAESFETDFLNARGVEIKKAMLEMGGFVFRSSGLDDEGNVYFKGERNDGTNIKIIIKEGSGYKSPAEIAQKEKEEKKNNNFKSA